MKVRGWHDLLSGAAFIAIGATALYMVRRLPSGNLAAMGSAAFPNVLGAVLVGIGLLLVVRSLRGAAQRLPSIAWRPLILIPASIALFAVLVLRIGLLASAVIMVVVAGLASYDASVGLRRLLALAALLAVAAAAIFGWALGLPLPILPP